MLSYVLAIAVAISSLVLFSTAFLMSKIHRKDDFLWSAVGLFYALILWYCARNITGAVLLGQAAATVLVVAYSWQTIKLRQAIANPTQASETNDFSVVRSINSLLKRQKPQVKPQVQVPTKSVTKTPAPKVTEQNIAIPETPAEVSEQTNQETTVAQDTVQDTVQDINVADATPLVKIVDKTTSNISSAISDVQDNSGDRKNQASKLVETEFSPLPNKLPEVAQVDEIKSAEKEVAIKEDAASEPTQENIQPELKPESKTEDLSQEISNEVQDKTPAPVESTSETVLAETAKDAKPKSSFDSLETVEVAEVLEAESDRQFNNREDRFNIIEVTTTEVNVTKEVIKLDDQNQDSDADFKDPKS